MHAATAVGMARFAASNLLLVLACIAVNGGVLAQISSRSDIDDLGGSAENPDDSTSDTEDGDVVELDCAKTVKYVEGSEFDLCSSRFPKGTVLWP